MPVVEVPKQLKCQRCTHKWTPRTREVLTCPKCKSPYWNKRKMNHTKEENHNGSSRGRSKG